MPPHPTGDDPMQWTSQDIDTALGSMFLAHQNGVPLTYEMLGLAINLTAKLACDAYTFGLMYLDPKKKRPVSVPIEDPGVLAAWDRLQAAQRMAYIIGVRLGIYPSPDKLHITVDDDGGENV